MSEGIKELTDESFDSVIEEGLTLVDFWAPWCQPCKMQGPILESVAKQVDSDITIAKADVENNESHAREYGVRGVPTLIIFEDGSPVQEMVGLQDEQTLLDALESARSQAAQQ